MSKEVLQEALELLAVATFITPKLQAKRTDVINAGLQALAEQPAQQEPVAWMIEYEACGGGMNRGSSLKKFDYVWHKCSFVSENKDAEIDATKWRNRKETPLYTTPPAQRTWVGLTLEDTETTHWSPDFRAGAKWAAAKLKEKNT